MKLDGVGSIKEWDPVSFRVLVKVKEVEETSTGGIILTSTTQEQYNYSSGEGIVVKLGPTAFQEFRGDPWCKVGDTVTFRSFSGCEKRMVDDDGVECLYRCINDDDIILVKESKDD